MALVSSIMFYLDGCKQILSSVIDAGYDITEFLCVGSPQNKDFVHTTLLLEVTNVPPELCHLC